jgi:hypothetical protein
MPTQVRTIRYQVEILVFIYFMPLNYFQFGLFGCPYTSCYFRLCEPRKRRGNPVPASTSLWIASPLQARNDGNYCYV